MFIFGANVDQSVICALPISALRVCIQVTVFLVHINGSQPLHPYKLLLTTTTTTNCYIPSRIIFHHGLDSVVQPSGRIFEWSTEYLRRCVQFIGNNVCNIHSYVMIGILVTRNTNKTYVDTNVIEILVTRNANKILCGYERDPVRMRTVFSVSAP
jgi:hypothetical protein